MLETNELILKILIKIQLYIKSDCWSLLKRKNTLCREIKKKCYGLILEIDRVSSYFIFSFNLFYLLHFCIIFFVLVLILFILIKKME